MELLDGWELRDLELEDAVEEELQPLEGDFALHLETVEEHVSRHGGNYEYILNEHDRDVLKADLGDRKLEVANLENGNTEIRYSTDHDSTETIYKREIQKLVDREERVYDAVDMLMNTMDDWDEPVEKFTDEIERLGGSHLEIAERYYSNDVDLSEVLMPYSFFFELKPWQEKSENYHESLKGEIPLGESDGKGVYWLRKYLDTATETTIEKYGDSGTLRESWLSSGKTGNAEA